MATSNRDKPRLNCSFCNIRRHNKIITLDADFVKHVHNPLIKSTLNYYPMICWRIKFFKLSFRTVVQIYRLLFKCDPTKNMHKTTNQ